MPISFLNQTVTVIRPAWVSERGDLVADWINATEHPITKCRVQPVVGDEIRNNRDAVITRWTLFAPTGADIESTDRVRHAGTVYDVDGDIRRWPSPTGELASTQATLQRVEG